MCWWGVAFFCASPAEWIEGDVTGVVVSAGRFVVWEEELCVCWEPEGSGPRDRLSSSQALRKVFRGGGGGIVTILYLFVLLRLVPAACCSQRGERQLFVNSLWGFAGL